MKNTPKSSQLALRKPSSKKIWLFVIILSLVAIITIAWYINTNSSSDKLPNGEKTSNSDKNDPSSIKDDRETPQTGLPANSNSTTSEQVPESTTTNVDITDFAQKDGSVQASATVSSLEENGSCVFTFSSEGAKPVVRQKASTGSDGPKSCTVSIPEVEFTKLGTWNLNVTFYINDTRSEANRNVTIQ